MSKEIVTPVGRVAKPLIKTVMEVAGLRWKEDDWCLVSESVEATSINQNNQRKANESHFIKRKLWLPIRYYNFMYSLSESGFDITKAIEHCKEKCFDMDGSPSYLPGKFEIKTGERLSYTRIMKLVEEKHRNFKSK